MITRSTITTNESGFYFLAALIATFALQLILSVMRSMGVDMTSEVALYIQLAMIQVFILASIVVVGKLSRAHFVRATHIGCRFSIAQAVIAAMAAIVMIFFSGPIAYGFDVLLSLTTYKSSVSMVSINEPYQFAAAFFVMCIFAPFCEEFLMRGVVLNGLCKRGKIFGIVLSAFFFALFHGNAQQLIHQFSLGLLLGYLAVMSRSFWPAFIAHAVNNIVAITFEYIGFGFFVIEWYVLIFIVIAAFILLLLMAKWFAYESLKRQDKAQGAKIVYEKSVFARAAISCKKLAMDSFSLFSKNKRKETIKNFESLLENAYDKKEETVVTLNGCEVSAQILERYNGMRTVKGALLVAGLIWIVNFILSFI